MAIRCHLTRIPTDIFDSVKKSGGFQPNNDVVGYQYNWQKFEIISIDTTWWTFHQAFQKQGFPLSYAIQGDYAPSGGLVFFARTEGGDSYSAYVSPKATIQISKALGDFEFDRIADFSDMTDRLIDEYFLPCFQELKKFYRDTAKNGEAVFITIG